jgi:hypothetical protein
MQRAIGSLLCLAISASLASAQEPGKSKTWAFTPTQDPFSDKALLDLRYLNEKTAGEKGFIRLSADGSGFLLGDGTPVRFWAVGDTVYTKTDAELAYHARFLAKQGVNMVRMHGSFAPKAPGSKMTDVDTAELDRAWRLVAAMKKKGIYTTISPYWAAGGHTGTAASWGIAGYGDKADLWGLLFFRDDLKAAYKSWMRAVLTRTNPYTGIPLGKDPALAIIQIQNEDSLFFWTLQGMKPVQLELLGKKFGQWLVKKYGSLGAVRKAWNGQSAEGDKFSEGKVGILITWQMTQPHQGGMARRVRDQVHFLAELQRGFYAEMARYFREDLGCKQLVNASNWITADTEKLNDLERWTYTATDVLAVNKYFNGGPHNGPNAGWRIDPGDFFEGHSVLKDPTALPTDLKQVIGHPTMITESCWVFPLAYESEGPFLVAAYESLTGVGPYYWFSADTPGYCTDPYFAYQTFPDGQKGVFKWSVHPGGKRKGCSKTACGCAVSDSAALRQDGDADDYFLPPRFRFGGRRMSRSRRGSTQRPADSSTVTPRSGSSLSPAKTSVLPAARPWTSTTPKPIGRSCSELSASSYARRPAGRIPSLRNTAAGRKVSVAPVSTSARPVQDLAEPAIGRTVISA